MPSSRIQYKQGENDEVNQSHEGTCQSKELAHRQDADGPGRHSRAVGARRDIHGLAAA